MKEYKNLTLDEERALYGLNGARIEKCTFAGPKDGESALKECRNVTVNDCVFNLRYPLWHVEHGRVIAADMSTTCRAPLWYDKDISLENCKLNGIKTLRECSRIKIQNCTINSAEFGWFCHNIAIEESELTAEYALLKSTDLTISDLKMHGKYSFQYVENATIYNSKLDTKDAFWHSQNTTVIDSTLMGEYLGWYAQNLTLIRCRIGGTQPLCYAKNLCLIDCVMEPSCDLAFERSLVTATIKSPVTSIKNPLSGSYIEVQEVGEIIQDIGENPVINTV